MERTNSELNIMFQNIEDKMEERHKDNQEILARIEQQTSKTNGRVTELEKWKWLVMGAVSILTAMVLPIAFILLKNLHL